LVKEKESLLGFRFNYCVEKTPFQSWKQQFQQFRLVSLGIGLYLYLILGVGSLFLFLRCRTGLVAFGAFCGLVFSNCGYICLFTSAPTGV
ncbi:MAG: hypothetical protein EZS28_014565, partial [Streblomastix strix]